MTKKDYNQEREDRILTELTDFSFELEEIMKALVKMEWDSDSGKLKVEALLKDMEELEGELSKL